MGRWNALLERRFPLRALGRTDRISHKALGKRVACDQLIMFVPVFCTLLLIMLTWSSRAPAGVCRFHIDFSGLNPNPDPNPVARIFHRFNRCDGGT